MSGCVKHCVSCETHDARHWEGAEESLRERLAAFGIRLLRQTPGRRRLISHGGKLCSRCLINPPLPGQRYCAECHAAACRESRARIKAKHEAMRAKIAAYEEGARQ
jgi:hypothetical protein